MDSAQPSRRRVFLSYANADREQAEKLRFLLEAHPGIEVFSTDMLSAGGDWQSKLRGELEACDVFAVVFSPNSMTSPWVLQELGAAWSLDKPILSIATKRDLPAELPVPREKTQTVNLDELKKPEDLDRWIFSSKNKAHPLLKTAAAASAKKTGLSKKAAVAK